MHGNFREDVGDDRDAGEVHSALPAEAALEELRHREHVGAQIKRDEHPSENQQDQAGQPLEVSDRQSGARARAGQADEVLGRNVRHEQRRADRKPSHVAAGEEVVGGSALFAREIQADAKR